MNLFQRIQFTSAAGLDLDWKLECDALTDADWDCLAYMISQRVSFYAVIGVPTGGKKLAEALGQYTSHEHDRYLIVDDVLTTGKSIEDVRRRLPLSNDRVIGYVVFNRGWVRPSWVRALWTLDAN